MNQEEKLEIILEKTKMLHVKCEAISEVLSNQYRELIVRITAIEAYIERKEKV